MTASPVATSADMLYACSNLEDIIACLGRLRLTARPTRGLGHLSVRPMVIDGLTPEDVRHLSGGFVHNAPVLVEVPARFAGPAGAQVRSIPLDELGELVFPSLDVRDRAMNTLLGDASAEGLRSRVDPGRFALAGAPRLNGGELPALAWSADRDALADALAGAVAGLLQALDSQPLCRAFVATRCPDILAALGEPAPCANDDSETRALRAAVRALVPLSGRPDADSLTIAEEFAREFGTVCGVAGLANTWLQWARALLSNDRYLKADEVRDPAPGEGSAVLRSMLLVLFRESAADVLVSPVEQSLPAPGVMTLTCLFAGLREGLARMESRCKTPLRAVLGALATEIEAEGAVSALIRLQVDLHGRQAGAADASAVTSEPEPIREDGRVPVPAVPEAGTAQLQSGPGVHVALADEHADETTSASEAAGASLLERLASLIRQEGLGIVWKGSGFVVRDGTEEVRVSPPARRAARAAAMPDGTGPAQADAMQPARDVASARARRARGPGATKPAAGELTLPGTDASVPPVPGSGAPATPFSSD